MENLIPANRLLTADDSIIQLNIKDSSAYHKTSYQTYFGTFQWIGRAFKFIHTEFILLFSTLREISNDGTFNKVYYN